MRTLTSKSLLAAVLLTLMGAAWWMQVRGSVLPVARAPAARRPSPTAPEAPNVALHRLRERRAVASTGHNGRDPFGGGAAPGMSADPWGGAVPRDAASLREEPGGIAAPAHPRLELIGVAAAPAGAEGLVAVLAGERGVTHARAGDLVAGVYRIERVSADAVEVRLVPDDRVFSLRLR